jgi:transposase
VHEAPSPSGLYSVSERHRGKSIKEKDDPHHRHPQASRRRTAARKTSAVFHTPTSASWLNAIEGFFAKLTKKRLKRGVFRSLRELKDSIHRFLDETNANPKPFTWTKDPNKIIAAVRRGHQVLDPIH